jgi:hypothetical protein
MASARLVITEQISLEAELLGSGCSHWRFTEDWPGSTVPGVTVLDQLGQVDVLGVLQLLGAGSIGGFVADWLLKRRERREARARVQEAIGLVGERMWVDYKRDLDEQWRELRRALRALSSATLIAGLSQRHLDLHASVVVSCWRLQRDRLELGRYDEEIGVGIPLEASDAYRIATKPLVIRLWRPWIGRLHPSSWRRRVKRQVFGIAEQMAEEDREGRSFKRSLEDEWL